MEQNINENHSNLTFMNNIENVAAVIPTDWMIMLKSLATVGWTAKASVITGKATAPPPTLVIPAT